jgi:hypothetical protein
MSQPSNLPSWPSSAEKQATSVRKLLTSSPQTASELADFFAEGETIVSVLVQCLEANAALGFATLDRKGWVASEPSPSPVYGSQRLLKNWSIQALVDLHDGHKKPDGEMQDSDWSALLSLYFELQYRKTPKAKQLREGLRDRLILNRRFPGDDRTEGHLHLK